MSLPWVCWTVAVGQIQQQGIVFVLLWPLVFAWMYNMTFMPPKMTHLVSEDTL